MVPWTLGRLKGGTPDVEIIVHDDSDVELLVPSRPALSGGGAKAVTAPQSGDAQSKASALVAQALGSKEHHALAEAICEAFFVAAAAAGPGTEATPRLRSLIAALKANEVLRCSVLEGGIQAASALASQDPREWARDEVKAQREEWASDALAEASRVIGEVRSCPECGGKAMYETGSSAAYKMAKAYAHYKCVEVNCGKVTHEKE
mmetsp:Transcript_130195/g.324623  ORF Transcript_130195/g.324623 Transcript_130195/m.324623 type:complete len:205 (+) Transcript_130195:68-682(+)